MKQEDKELLLKDLCGRLPYGVKVHIKGEYHKYHEIEEIDVSSECVRYFENFHLYEEKITDCCLYLRPMSSMTEEEKKELKCLFDAKNITNDSICFLEGGTLEEYEAQIPFSFCSKLIDYLNAHHFDYRGLIEKGLALEAPKGMYK